VINAGVSGGEIIIKTPAPPSPPSPPAAPVQSLINSDISIPKNDRYFRDLGIDTIGIECPNLYSELYSDLENSKLSLRKS
jgi:hypothetical protein